MLSIAREFQSSQTGLIHRGDVIPLYENLCFALALFRSHIGEQVEEGKDILRRLLPFYAQGFPLYLHEYPNPSTPAHQVRCALPIHWILKLYHRVIELPLKKELEKILQGLDPSHLSPLYEMLYLALKGKEIPRYTPCFSHEWGLLLLAYQLLDEKPSWILEEALECWHPELMAYSGPPLQEYQRKKEPELTLYDLFMAEHQRDTSQRFQGSHPIHLQAALVFPFKKPLPLCSPKTLMFQTERREKWSAKGFHLIRYLWGNADTLYSLVCQEDLQLEQKGEDFLLTYPMEIPGEKERMELPLYCTHRPDVHLSVEGRKETVFELGEPVEIQTPEKTVTLIFSLEKGEGQFMGHIKRGNRPAQIGSLGPQDFTSHDWLIGLRTIHRSEDCIIRLRVL